MNDRFRETFRAGDIAAAFGILTRIPLPIDHALAGERAAKAVWAWPLVGAVLGGGSAIAGNLALWLGVPGGIAAALVLAVLVLATGALHEDGLADSADGLGGGGSAARRLEIMHDSRIGAYGATALTLVILARWSAIAALIGAGNLFWPMVAVGAISRLPMVLAMFMLDPARNDGLSAGIGVPAPAAVLGAFGVSLVMGVIAVGWGAIAMLIWGCLAAAALFLAARTLIGGHTGDVLGASQQLAEVASLASAAALPG